MAAHTQAYSFERQRSDRSPWDMLLRMAEEVGCVLEQHEPDSVTMVTFNPLEVTPAVQGRIMAIEFPESASRSDVSRAEYMEHICESAGVTFVDGRVA